MRRQNAKRKRPRSGRPAKQLVSGFPPAEPKRDQEASAFGEILRSLLRRVPGARAAALVDYEGETVDYAGRMDPFALRIAAAHFHIVFEQVRVPSAALRGGCARSLVVRGAERSYIFYDIAEGYGLLLVLSRRAGFAGWERAIQVCAHSLSSEAGWRVGRPGWFAVEIVTDERRRPVRVKCEAEERRVEVLGALVGHSRRRERAWRVRLDDGVEALLVREPGGSWYADEPLHQPVRPAPLRR